MATITGINISNFLSFEELELRLGTLNVLVGPNGAGKTNLLRVFQFLGEVARSDLAPAVDAFGGFEGIRFRGPGNRSRRVTIKLRGQVTKNSSLSALDEYELTFWDQKFGSRSLIQRREELRYKRTAGAGRRITLTGGSVDFLDVPAGQKSSAKKAGNVSVQSNSSGLAIIRRLGKGYDSGQFAALAEVFEELRLFEVDVAEVKNLANKGTNSKLDSNAGNLAEFLLWLKEKHHSRFKAVCEDVRFVLPSFQEFVFTAIGGSDSAIRLDLRERNLEGLTPLARASFGTIRSIALFAMLNDPNPPKLTCLEEVDHGLHPHALDRLVDRLKDASNRTQIVVATHSPAFVNRVDPDSLIIFEEDPETGATRRADVTPEQITKMQEETGYGPGELWFSGTLGGVP